MRSIEKTIMVLLAMVVVVSIAEGVWAPETRFANSTWTSEPYTWCVATGPGDRVHVVHTWYAAPDNEILYRGSTNRGTSWWVMNTLSNNSGSGWCPAVAVSGMNVYAVWTCGNKIYFRRSWDGGETFPNVEIPVVNDPSQNPCIAATGNTVHLVWMEWDSSLGRDVVRYMRSTTYGDIWLLPAQTLSSAPAGKSASNASVSISGQYVHVAWHDTRDNAYGEVYYNRSINGGGSFVGETRRSDSDPAASSLPCVTTAGAVVNIVWRDARAGGKVGIYGCRSTDNGATWSANRYLIVGVSCDPQLQGVSAWAVGSDMHLVWADCDLSSYQYITHALSTDAGYSWWQTDRLPAPGLDPKYTSVAMDAYGDANIVWSDWRGGLPGVSFIRGNTDLIAGSTDSSSGRHLIREPGTPSNLHATFRSNTGQIGHMFSGNGGTNWTAPDYIDQGQYPSIGVGGVIGIENQGSCIAYLNGNELRYKWFNIATQTWQGFTVFPTFGPSARVIGPPSLYSTGDFVHIAYPVEDAGQYKIQYNTFAFNAVGPGTPEVVETRTGAPLTSPCIALDGNWTPHVVYLKDNRMMCRGRTGSPPNMWVDHPAFWPWPGTVSYQPFIDITGLRVSLCWSELVGSYRTIWRTARDMPGSWWPYSRFDENINNNPSESPVIAGGDCCTWAEFNTANNSFDPLNLRMFQGTRDTIDQTLATSYWPHTQLFADGLGRVTLYALWTEGSAPNYLVKFRSKVFQSDEGDAFGYSVICGEEKASPFCVLRTSNKQVGGYAIDYGNDSLVYNLDYLDPRYDYTVQVLYVHNGTTAWTQRVAVDGAQGVVVSAPPRKLEALSVKIPNLLYEKDHAIRLKLTRESGSYAFCQKIHVDATERMRKAKGGGSGGQSSSMGLCIPTLSVHVLPNPSIGSCVAISYVLGEEAEVVGTIHDVAGRMIRRLHLGRQTLGAHVARWDCRDDSGRPMPAGVYFLDLMAGSNSRTVKVLLVK